jgi:hypothetical protein
LNPSFIGDVITAKLLGAGQDVADGIAVSISDDQLDLSVDAEVGGESRHVRVSCGPDCSLADDATLMSAINNVVRVLNRRAA